jgi:predicted HTH transcriptional regulator
MKHWVERAKALLASSVEPPHHELNEIDWKSSVSPNKQRLIEHLCAFANYPGGGWLVYGIKSDCSFIGITPPEIEVAINQLANLGRDAVEPSLQIDHLGMDFNGHPILFVYIPESAIKPVHRKGRPESESHIRSGGTTRTASRQEIGSMMLQSKTPRWEDLHATTLMTDDELLLALDVEPIFEMLDKPSLTLPEQDSLSYLAAVIRGQIHPKGDLSSLDTNMVVTQILDAARESAKTGKTVKLSRLGE